MSTRSNIRPRPVDVNKQLVIYKDASELELDTADVQAAELASQGHGHGSGHGHGGGHGNNNAKKPKAIPIPDMREVETHYRDYLPLFTTSLTYLHGKGVGGAREPDPVEYDLDNEDEDWLRTYNLGRNKLHDLLFEKMLWKLELACAEATDNALTAAGAGPSERTAASAVAAIDHLPKQEALRILALQCGGREKLLNDVYGYWAAKRKRWGKPILRRLQAPTIASDTNPYNTFRTREKINRPQTRRRRDNSEELLDKLRLLKDNLVSARAIMDEVVRRERRKRDLACTEIELMRISWRHHHEGSRLSFDQISQDGLQMLRERIRLNGHQDSIRGGLRILANKAQLQASMPPSKRPRRDGVLRYLRQHVAGMIPPPPGQEPECLWAMPTNLLQIPLESKGKQQDRMDDIRRGRPVLPPSAAAAAAGAGASSAAAAAGGVAVKAEPGIGNDSSAATAAGSTAAGGNANAAADGAKATGRASDAGAAAAGGDAAANGAAAGAEGKAASSSAAAAGSSAAAGADASGKQQPAGTAAAAGDKPPAGAGAASSGLPPAGPGSAHKMNAVMAALHDREHLYKLPDSIASSIQNWRCFIGRGGRARLECIDHVTHETFTAVKAEAQAVAAHYQTEPWPPMPTAPNLRELVDKYRPPMPRQQGMSRTTSLASQPSSSSAMMQAGGSAAPAAQQRHRYMQQQYPNPQMAAAAAAAAAGGGIAPAPSMQQPQQQHVMPQAQPAHRAGMQAQQQSVTQSAASDATAVHRAAAAAAGQEIKQEPGSTAG